VLCSYIILCWLQPSSFQGTVKKSWKANVSPVPTSRKIQRKWVTWAPPSTEGSIWKASPWGQGCLGLGDPVRLFPSQHILCSFEDPRPHLLWEADTVINQGKQNQLCFP
jgi:hypothetical protein